MKCKKCGKECMENELVNGFCKECIDKYGENSEELRDVENRIARIIKILVGIIIVLGIICMIISFSYDIIYTVIIILSTFISALLLRAIAEIIQLLEDIKNK